MIWCEEAAFMPPPIFIKIVLPLLEVANAVLLMITTVTNKYSLFHKVTEKRMPDTGEMIFNKLVIRLQCERCRKLRKRCVHNLHLLPHWKSVGKFQINSVLYGEENEETRQQESLGITDESEGGFIEAWWIDRLQKEPRFRHNIEMPPNYVHICVDPQAGGASGYAFTAVTLFQGRFIVSRPHPTRRRRTSPRPRRGTRACARTPRRGARRTSAWSARSRHRPASPPVGAPCRAAR